MITIRKNKHNRINITGGNDECENCNNSNSRVCLSCEKEFEVEGFTLKNGNSGEIIHETKSFVRIEDALIYEKKDK